MGKDIFDDFLTNEDQEDFDKEYNKSKEETKFRKSLSILGIDSDIIDNIISTLEQLAKSGSKVTETMKNIFQLGNDNNCLSSDYIAATTENVSDIYMDFGYDIQANQLSDSKDSFIKIYNMLKENKVSDKNCKDIIIPLLEAESIDEVINVFDNNAFSNLNSTDKKKFFEEIAKIKYAQGNKELYRDIRNDRAMLIDLDNIFEKYGIPDNKKIDAMNRILLGESAKDIFADNLLNSQHFKIVDFKEFNTIMNDLNSKAVFRTSPEFAEIYKDKNKIISLGQLFESYGMSKADAQDIIKKMLTEKFDSKELINEMIQKALNNKDITQNIDAKFVEKLNKYIAQNEIDINEIDFTDFVSLAKKNDKSNTVPELFDGKKYMKEMKDLARTDILAYMQEFQNVTIQDPSKMNYFDIRDLNVAFNYFGAEYNVIAEMYMKMGRENLNSYIAMTLPNVNITDSRNMSDIYNHYRIEELYCNQIKYYQDEALDDIIDRNINSISGIESLNKKPKQKESNKDDDLVI